MTITFQVRGAMVKTPGVPKASPTSSIPQVWGFYRTIESRFGPSTSTPKKRRENSSSRSVPIRPPETWNIDLSPQLPLESMIPWFKSENTNKTIGSNQVNVFLTIIITNLFYFNFVIENATVHNRSTHTSQERSRHILRNAGIESDALSSSTTVTVDSTSVENHARNTRDCHSNFDFANKTFPISNRSMVLSRTLSTDLCSPSTVNNPRPVSRTNSQRLTRTFVIESLSSSRDDRHPDWVDPQSPAFYLRMKRPDFIRRLEHRQAVIKAASASRKQIESRRRNAARALVQGQISIGSARSALFADPTEVKAFPQTDMKAITKRCF
uniref:Uncharacterized protein n=1 Tax=Heterorhabditis bacteriophora TaxID=37862 RepID=A0A1I7WGK6_HETBA